MAAFELLVEPPSRRGPSRVCARLRLFQPSGALRETVRMLLPEALLTLTLTHNPNSNQVRMLLPDAHGSVPLYSAAPDRVGRVAPRRVAAAPGAPPTGDAAVRVRVRVRVEA